MKAIRLNADNYEVRTTLGGGTVRDLMPEILGEGAVAYVIEGNLEEPKRYGILYQLKEGCPNCGDDTLPNRWKADIAWLGTSLSGAFGDGVSIIDIEDTPSLGSPPPGGWWEEEG